MEKTTVPIYPVMPTVLVIFGATGDLIRKKIIPALYHLYRADKLPSKMKIIGVARRNFSLPEFYSHILSILAPHIDRDDPVEEISSFIQLFSYHQGFFEDPGSYRSLKDKLQQLDDTWGMCSNKLFYLAIPPQLYYPVLENLHASELTRGCSPEEGWTRLIVEKPFGKDARTAAELDEFLGQRFKEEQIYRIDHYLAKEMVQNILSFRFSNNLFEKNWDSETIESINIRLWESMGVEDRGNFYDGVGALRDVGQNHLLQMLAFTTMEHPLVFEPQAIRAGRALALKKLHVLTKEEVAAMTYRAQYEGYEKIEGVNPGSDTETFFKVRSYFESGRLRSVPVTMEGGKRIGEQRKDMEVNFKHPQPCLCPPNAPHLRNKVVFSIDPQEEISIHFWSKKPGFDYDIEQRTFDFFLRQKDKKSQYIEEYQKLLLDCIRGDQTLFLSTEEVKQMWNFIDPIVEAWKNGAVPLERYKPDSLRNTDFILQGNFSDQGEKEIGILGLGKMGAGIARRLLEKGWRVVGYNRSKEIVHELKKEGMEGADSLREFVEKLKPPRIIWLMLPAGSTIDEVVFGTDGIVKFLSPGDFIVDGGNSYFKDSVFRYKKSIEAGLRFMDVGFSGGPSGARHGGSLMIGGYEDDYWNLEHLYRDLAIAGGYKFFSGPGAGHFVKMIHNGIEYGMMQAIAEGFEVLKRSIYSLNLKDVAEIYNNGSVIQSRLIKWLQEAFEIRNQNLDGVSSKVAHTGEGEWTVRTAQEMGVKVKIIEEALNFRIESEKNPRYAGKILSALRERFGGHSVGKDN